MLSTNTNVYLIQILTASFNSSLLFLSTFFLISKKNKIFLIYDKNSRSHNLLPQNKKKKKKKKRNLIIQPFNPTHKKLYSQSRLQIRFHLASAFNFRSGRICGLQRTPAGFWQTCIRGQKQFIDPVWATADEEKKRKKKERKKELINARLVSCWGLDSGAISSLWSDRRE